MKTEREKQSVSVWTFPGVCNKEITYYAFSRCFYSDLQYKNINSVTEQTMFTVYFTMPDVLERYDMQRMKCHLN